LTTQELCTSDWTSSIMNKRRSMVLNSSHDTVTHTPSR
jgi:hypothetical protein